MKQNLIEFNASATEREQSFLEFLGYCGAHCEGSVPLSSGADNTSIPSVLRARLGLWQLWPRWESDSRVRKVTGEAGESGEPRGSAAGAAGWNQAQKGGLFQQLLPERSTGFWGAQMKGSQTNGITGRAQRSPDQPTGN